MISGDLEPLHIYKSSVLHVAKNEYKKSQYFDSDPIKALCIMEYMLMSIHNIGISVFHPLLG